MINTGELPDQVPANIEITKEEWKMAKEIQQQNINNHSKFRRKESDKENKLNHSFISVIDPTSKSPKLYGLANNGQIFGKGEFGKTKPAIDEDGNVVAVKIITTVVKVANIVSSEQLVSTEDSELKIETKLGRNKGSFNLYSPSRKPRKRSPGGEEQPLAEDEIALKKYQVVDYLGVSLKDILEGKMDTSGKIISPKIHLSDEQKNEIAFGLFAAVKELNDQNILHNDLHPGNILIDLNKKPIRVNVIDFGLSCELNPNEAQISIIGRPFNKNILPPEIANNYHTFLSKKTDAWQTGNVLFRSLGLEMWYVYKLTDSNPNTRPIIDDGFLAAVKEFNDNDIDSDSDNDSDSDTPKHLSEEDVDNVTDENALPNNDGGYGTFVINSDSLYKLRKNLDKQSRNIQSAENYLDNKSIRGEKNAHKKFSV